MKIQLFLRSVLWVAAAAVLQADSRNLLLNSEFNFHSHIPHRYGKAASFTANYVPFWNAGTAKSLRVLRDSHIAKKLLPPFSVACGVELLPGQQFHQFFTLPEAELVPGDAVSLSFWGHQFEPDALKAELRAMKLESADGTWSPAKDFKLRDKRTFNKMSRGELVVAAKVCASSKVCNSTVEFKAENLVIPGNFTPGKKSYAKDNNTVGIEVRFTNTSQKSVWIFAPGVVRGKTAKRAVGCFRSVPEYYRHIPRTMQKLWKGESIHILVMGSSIDRGSANPPMYPYDEDPASPTFKQPLSDSHTGFSTRSVGRPDLEPYFGWSNHYFSYAGRLKVELMKKFDLPGSKILLNFMACDGSSVGEAHSGLKEYCELLVPPKDWHNGHKTGSTWQELYPELFSRPEGPRPDLVIFGSGANEKTDTPDEAAVFEGMIRYIQRNYPGVEFVGCMYQNKGGYTPNPGDMQALALRYGFPFIDFGIINDRLLRNINPHAIGNSDGHPQAGIHYIWFKQLERAFECTGPVVSGFPQQYLPERVMPGAVNWEGRMKLYQEKDPRFFRNNAIVIDDGAFNSWAYPEGKVDPKAPTPRSDLFADGVCVVPNRRMHRYDKRNAFAPFGRLSFGDRHVIEVKPPFKFHAVEAKQILNRNYIGVESALFAGVGKVQAYKSQTGYPYGRYITLLQPGETCRVTVAGNAFSVAWADAPGSGTLTLKIDGRKVFSAATDKPFVLLDKSSVYMENRKGVRGFAYGMHTLEFTAEKSPVRLMGVFVYDLRSNRAAERTVRGVSGSGEFVFEPAFKAVPLIRCFGNLKLEEAEPHAAVFSGTGSFEAVGE